MFHRVKSEILPEAKTTPEAENADDAKDLYAASPLEEAVADDEVVEETSAEASQTPPEEEKENETMTDQTDTNEAEEKSEAKTGSRLDTPSGSYKSTPSQSAARPGGYPGAYPGVAYGSSSRAPVEQTEYQDRTLTIGAGITMSGEIESCDNLIVEGTVEAALKGARNLDIAESGTFYGTVEIEQAVIAGRFEGDLTVNGRLVLKSGGVITGSIAYGELEIEAGAVIDGRLTPVAASASAQQAAPAASSNAAPKAKVTSNEAAKKPANADGSLFAAKA